MPYTIMIIILFILILIFIYLQKNKYIQESLIVSPSKLYSHTNTTQEICYIDNINENNETYANYININDYIKIKNNDIDKRLGEELVGKKVRILLYEPNLDVPSYLSEIEEECSEEKSFQNTTNICNSKIELEDLTGYNTNDILFTNISHYRRKSNKKNSYWYEANIINYNMDYYPCSLHKIQWRNIYESIETRWINLYNYNIEVPIQPKHILTKNGLMLDDTSTEDEKKSFYEQIQFNCNYEKPKKVIVCSSNEDCKKYGMTSCYGGFCDSSFYNI